MSETIGQQFMRLTTQANNPPNGESQGLPQPPLELDPGPIEALIPLPRPEDSPPPDADLTLLLSRRRTARRYSAEPLTMAELAYLLWCTQGVEEVTDRPATLRPVPSAGARHAFETYLLTNRVEGLPAGVYRYAAIEHALLRLDFPDDIAEQIRLACLQQKQIANSAATFFWVAVLERMTWRYSQRGYRYLHLDAGHVCQNLYLAGEALGCRCCAIGAFDEELLNATLGLDGVDRFVVYAGSVGKRLEK